MTNFLEKNLNNILESTVSLSNNSIYWMNKEGKLIFANDNALNDLGYSLEELIKLYVWDVDIIFNSKEKFLQAIKTFEKNAPYGEQNTIQTKHKRKNGETFPVEVVSKFKIIDNEKYVISYVKDITMRLQRTEDINFYFDLIDSSKDMIFLVSHEEGLIEFANKTACNILGYSLKDIKNMKVSHFRKPFEGKDNIELPDVFKKIADENNMTTFGIYTTRTGREVPVETSLKLKEYHGQNYIVAVSRDISERLNIEIEKEKLNKKLNEYNGKLKAEIEEVKNELSEYDNTMRKQARMAAMGEMIENIAHQWRQPLSAISMLSTGLILQNQQSLLDKNSLEKELFNINDNIQYLSNTIDDFRNFFKPDKEKNLFLINKFIDNAIKLTMSKFKTFDFNFIVVNEYQQELNTYESELLQVFLNLINNAIDELQKIDYEKFIFIETSKKDNFFFINIKDNAGGINETIIDRIFEPYFTTKHDYHGTGIGLYMSQNIIKHMNGELKVKNVNFEYNNKYYNGACFTIEVPL